MKDIKANRLMVALLRAAGFYLLLVTCPATGQALQKRPVTEADYHLWSEFTGIAISPDGQWLCYRKMFDSADTLFVKNPESGIEYKLANRTQATFSSGRWFAMKHQDSVELLELHTGTRADLGKFGSFEFLDDGRYFVYISISDDGKSNLIIRSLHNKEPETTILGASGYRESPNGKQVLCTWNDGSRFGVSLVTLGKAVQVKTIVTGADAFEGIAWGGRYVAFMQGAANKVYRYDTTTGNLLDSGGLPGIPAGMTLSDKNTLSLIASDGSRVIFPVYEPAAAKQNTLVEVWTTRDKQLPPNIGKYGDINKAHKYAAWMPEQKKITMITDSKLPKASGSADSRYALIYDPKQNEPQFDRHSRYDLWLTDLETGSRNLIVTDASYKPFANLIDPNGRYVYYEREYDWWVYDITLRTHRNMTKELGIPFEVATYDQAGSKPMWGVRGFGKQGASILVYDQFDIWELSATGSPVRLTSGRATQTIFRLAPVKSDEKFQVYDYLNNPGLYSIESGICVEVTQRAKGMSGYFFRLPDGRLKTLHWDVQQAEYLMKTSAANKYLLMSQRYNISPYLILTQPDAEPKVVVRSNPQQENYLWGRSERVEYTVDGQLLSGVLIFPASYDPTKKYPMVVSIYERQSHTINEYYNPSLKNWVGFNPSNLSAKGYFILKPDIVYRMLSPGPSALYCVNTAVDTVLAKYPIDSGRVGLIGHSFGGYETDFIISHTDRFAAAVSGCAITDLVSSYLHFGGQTGAPDFWRYEHAQQRMGVSLFENTEAYLDNSPVLKAAEVNTPLLGWTGGSDNHVNYQQSIGFFLALHRLGKESTLLVYPDEAHVLADPEKQADLTRRIEEWFAKYLNP